MTERHHNYRYPGLEAVECAASARCQTVCVAVSVSLFSQVEVGPELAGEVLFWLDTNDRVALACCCRTTSLAWQQHWNSTLSELLYQVAGREEDVSSIAMGRLGKPACVQGTVRVLWDFQCDRMARGEPCDAASAASARTLVSNVHLLYTAHPRSADISLCIANYLWLHHPTRMPIRPVITPQTNQPFQICEVIHSNSDWLENCRVKLGNFNLLLVSVASFLAIWSNTLLHYYCRLRAWLRVRLWGRRRRRRRRRTTSHWHSQAIYLHVVVAKKGKNVET